MLIVAGLLTALLLGFTEPLLHLLGARGDTLELCAEYARVIALGAVFQLLATALRPVYPQYGRRDRCHGRHAYGAGLQPRRHFFHRADPRRPASGCGLPCHADLSAVYVGRNGVRHRRHFGDLPCSGRRPERLRQKGLLVLYVELCGRRHSDVGPVPALYGPHPLPHRCQRRNMGLCKKLSDHRELLRPLCTHRQLLLQYHPCGRTVRQSRAVALLAALRAALRVAFADFSASPWQGFEKSERGPNSSSLFQPLAAVVAVAVQVLLSAQKRKLSTLY